MSEGIRNGPLALVTAADLISDEIYPRNKLSLGSDGTAVDAVAGAGVNGTGVQRVTVATDDALHTKLQPMSKSFEGDYETVAASQSTQALGATGAAGDYLYGLLIVPATTSPGNVQIKDGSNSAITVFTGGATSVADLKPFLIPLNMVSVVGAWQVTTGANVSAIGVGSFT